MKKKSNKNDFNVEERSIHTWVDVYNLIMENRLEQVDEILKTFPENVRGQVLSTSIESALLNGGIDVKSAINLLTKHLGGDYGKKFEDKLWLTYPNFSDKHFNNRPR